MVNVLACFSDNPSSNPAEAYSFFGKMLFDESKRIQNQAHLKNKALAIEFYKSRD